MVKYILHLIACLFFCSSCSSQIAEQEPNNSVANLQKAEDKDSLIVPQVINIINPNGQTIKNRFNQPKNYK